MRYWRLIWLTVLLMLAGGRACLAETPAQKPIGEYSLHDFAAKWMMQQDDIADINRYAAANQALIARGDNDRLIVLFGDSITFHWPQDQLPALDAHQFVNRGIPGQNSSQMLLRFESDVVALSPSVVVLLAGTNDLRAYAGRPEAIREQVLDRATRNITAMADIAKARNIDVILCALPPVGPTQAGVFRDPETIVALNHWLKDFANTRGLGFVDYHHAVLGKKGYLNTAYTSDDLHVNAQGYRAMTDRLAPVLHDRLENTGSAN